MEIFDGLTYNSSSLGKFCGRSVPSPIAVLGLQARVIFHAGERHLESLQGIRITYVTAQLGKCNNGIVFIKFIL